MDGAEFHGKWPHGGKVTTVFSVDDWLSEVPLVEHKTKQTWREKVTGLRAAAKAAGRADLLLANNEYGLGKPPSFGSDFDRFTKSMVVVEFALEMHVGGYDMASFWDNSDGGHIDHADQMLLDTQAGYRMNPMHFGLEMLARAGGTNEAHAMVVMNTTEVRVHGFAAIGKAGGKDEVLCYLINKNKLPRTIEIKLAGTSASATATAESMVDTNDHWGAMTPPAPLKCSAGGASCAATLPPLSFTLISYTLM
jgi:hypothetical protein